MEGEAGHEDEVETEGRDAQEMIEKKLTELDFIENANVCGFEKEIEINGAKAGFIRIYIEGVNKEVKIS